MKQSITLLLIILLAYFTAKSQTPYLVKDINVGSGNAFSTSTNFVCLDGKMIFAPISADHGREIWVTDGTEAGTSMIKDINPGVGDGLRIGHSLFLFNDGVLFPARDGISGTELWYTDGTEAGTYMIKDINVGAGSSMLNPYFFLFDGKVYFSASSNGGSIQKNLWVTDGTNTGTVLVKNTNLNSNPGPEYIVMNNEFYFKARINDGYEMWKSDGTNAGTIQLKDINPGVSNGLTSSLSDHIIFNNELYFWANDGVHDRELWKTDGTEMGTTMLKDINPAGGNGHFSRTILELNNALYFWADDNINGTELWKSDGSEFGTTLVKDINPNGDGTPLSGRLYLYNNVIYFVGSSFTGSRGELWKTDGSEIGTILVKDIAVNAGDGISRISLLLGELYFGYFFTNGGTDLWKSDGTASGTKLIKGFTPGPSNGVNNVKDLYQVNDKIYFSADDAIHGLELWESDGTTNGTVMTLDATPGPNGAFARNFAGICNHLYYMYTGPTAGYELWAINIGQINNLEEADTSIDIEFYPNPVRQLLTIKSKQMLKTKIYNLQGKLILETFENNISTENLSTGIYIIQFINDQQEIIKSSKLIKN